MWFGGGGVVAAGVAYSQWRGLGTMEEYVAAVARSREVSEAVPEVGGLLRYATLAPSGHNAQPWRFRVAPGLIEILPDFARRTPVVDPDDHHLFVSLGAAAENLALSASGEVSFDPAGDGVVRFGYGPGRAVSALFDAIPVRQSSRSLYDGRAVGAAVLGALRAAAEVPGVDVVVITERAAKDRLRDMVVAGNAAQMADAAFVRELKSWLRFNPRQALAAGDGLFSAASGSPSVPSWLGPWLFDLAFRAEASGAGYARQIGGSAGVAVFAGAKADRAHWVQVGRACQRFALQATALGLKTAFVNQPVEVPALRAGLAELAGLGLRRPDLVLRFGYGPALPYSARRAAVLV
jgi:nitroreductase